MKTEVEVIETDNLDLNTTNLILSNDTVVEVNVVELMRNAIENLDESMVKEFDMLIKKIEDRN